MDSNDDPASALHDLRFVPLQWHPRCKPGASPPLPPPAFTMALNAADDLCPPYDFQMERQVLRQRDANRTQREAELKQKAEAREAAERARVEAQKADAAKAETQKAEAAKAKSVAEAQAVSAKAHEEEESSSASKQTTRAKMVQAAEGALARAAAAAVLGKARVEAAAGEVAAIVKDKTETLGVSPPKPGRKSSASSQGVPGTTTSAEQQQQQQRQYPPLNNYLDFEQGLPPSNPWDTPETVHDAIQQLGGVSISAPAAGANNAASSSVPTSMPATSALPQSLRMPSALPSTLGKPQSLHDSPPSKSTLGYANATHMQQQQSQPNVPPPMRRVYDRVVKLGFRAMIVESAVWLFHGVAGGAAPSEVDHEKLIIDFCMHAENLLAGANAFTLADVHEAYRYVLSAPFTQPQSRHQQKVGYYLHAYRTVADLGFGAIKTRAALGATDPDAVAMAKGGSASVNYSKWGEEAANHLLMLES